MNIHYYLTPATGEPRVDGHGVAVAEAAEGLRNPGEDRLGWNKPRHEILDLSGA